MMRAPSFSDYGDEAKVTRDKSQDFANAVVRGAF